MDTVIIIVISIRIFSGNRLFSLSVMIENCIIYDSNETAQTTNTTFRNKPYTINFFTNWELNMMYNPTQEKTKGITATLS